MSDFYNNTPYKFEFPTTLSSWDLWLKNQELNQHYNSLRSKLTNTYGVPLSHVYPNMPVRSGTDEKKTKALYIPPGQHNSVGFER